MGKFRNHLMRSTWGTFADESSRGPIDDQVHPQLNAGTAGQVKLELNMPSVHLAKDERGLIISNPISIAGGKLSGSSNLDLQHLRFALLFWDKLDWPSNNLISFGSNNECDFLVQAGLLSRTHARLVGSGNGGDVLRSSFISTFMRRDETQPGYWSMARGSDSISFVDSELDVGRGILFGLHSAIPVPNRSVPLPDILEFKQKRFPELLSLRVHLEGLYQEVKAAPDQDLARLSAVSKLDQSLADYIRVLRSSEMPSSSINLSINLDLRDAVVGGLVAERMLSNGLDITSSVLSGVAATSVSASISFSLGAGLKGRIPSTPFQYIKSINERLW